MFILKDITNYTLSILSMLWNITRSWGSLGRLRLICLLNSHPMYLFYDILAIVWNGTWRIKCWVNNWGIAFILKKKYETSCPILLSKEKCNICFKAMMQLINWQSLSEASWTQAIYRMEMTCMIVSKYLHRPNPTPFSWLHLIRLKHDIRDKCRRQDAGIMQSAPEHRLSSRIIASH